jgi:predicted acetyltransferase
VCSAGPIGDRNAEYAGATTIAHSGRIYNRGRRRSRPADGSGRASPPAVRALNRGPRGDILQRLSRSPHEPADPADESAPVTPRPPHAHLPAGAVLADDAVELRLIRVLLPGDLAARPPEARFLSPALEYRFAIHRQTDGLRVGRIHLRVTGDPLILRALGHAGYAVDEAHRRNGYATRAIRLVAGLARLCDVSPLWVLIEPDNLASRKAVERAGFKLVDEVATRPEGVALGLGPRVCRYAIME